jgi:hypothetical protein
MNNAIRNTVLTLVALAAISVLARNFSGAATTTSTAPARHYYLTKGNFNGNQPLTACTTGYHFASFTELSDPAVLTYNKSLGLSQPDDGAGPPSFAYGWVRSGYVSNSTISPGTPTNCSLWTSAANTDAGEAGVFDPNPASPGGAEPVFEFLDANCDATDRLVSVGVWCVEN